MKPIALTAAILAFSQVALAGPPPNDDCSTPETITGTGVFNFDTTGATTGVEGQSFFLCDAIGIDGIEQDVWFCWTAECDGLVRIQTCGQTQVDTRINLWDGCNCPDDQVEAICCADDECDAQSDMTCTVECGRTYMIQLGSKPGTAGGPGTFTITCISDPCNGDPDPNGDCEVVAGQCCAARPNYMAADYALFGNGPIGAMTASPTILGGQVLTVYDFADFTAAVDGSNFPATRYSDPQWTANTLGSVFGITIDSSGNIYLAASTCYNNDVVGPGGWGNVYRVDSVTAAVTNFTTVPLPNSGPGLGNIVYDCDNDQFFVTNHEDGKIYRLDNGGNVLSTFDHAAADDGVPGFCPLGERVWGVTVHGDRVYYGVWNEDLGAQSGTVANEVWSVALVAGDFSGAETLEVTVPSYPGATYSNPVADIRFSEDGRMFLAERTMFGNTSTSAHDSRLLEYVCLNGTWQPGAPYITGVIAPGRNCAGGVDIDYRPGERIWATSDAIQFVPDVIYGAQGFPDGGGDDTTSILLDYQGNLDDTDKTELGDIALTCMPLCGTVEVKEIECFVDAAGFNNEYEALITINNTSGVDVAYLLIPGTSVVPNVIAFDPPIPDGSSQSVTVHLVGLAPGELHCIPFIMADSEVNECCSGEICFETPDCDCMILTDVELICVPDGSGGWQFGFTLQNLAPYTLEHLFLIAETPVGAVITPEYIDIPAVPSFGSTVVGPVVVTGVAAGDELCIRITVHAGDLELCCSEVLCLTVPDCPVALDPCDLNGDGNVGFADLLSLLSQWGPCESSECPADFDQDGSVGFADLVALLASWTV